ncbi:hypothetical protein AB945B12_02926 [Acinetobacter baumannii]|nr:hypothetical protein AB945B12_02926 [Acinetobacter baumannii]
MSILLFPINLNVSNQAKFWVLTGKTYKVDLM